MVLCTEQTGHELTDYYFQELIKQNIMSTKVCWNMIQAKIVGSYTHQHSKTIHHQL
jgi:hypothetical protein